MICKDCYFDLMVRVERDMLIFGEADYSDEDLTCNCDKPSIIIDIIEEKIRDNIEKTGAWDGRPNRS